MNYNNYFPASYQPIYPNQFQQQIQQNPIPQQQATMTAPTIHAEIVQISSMDEGVNYPVGAGQTQMMIMKDDSAILIKTAFPNGQSNLEVYERKKKDAVSAQPSYITREEFEKRISEITSNRKANAPQRRERSE